MRIFFSVGEPSGDQHAAELIDELRRRVPNLRATGFGGPRMQASGCDHLYPLAEKPVMGVFRILPLIPMYLRLIRQAGTFLANERPDAVILVDAPAFNWWIARQAKRHGIPVFYYLPPQLWAWAPWRISKVRRFVDYVISGLSFEADWYRQRGVDCEFTGHPFFDEVARHRLDQELMSEWLTSGRPIVGLLPGSRDQEIQKNFPTMIEVARQVHAASPDTRFCVACYKESQQQMCQDLLEDAIRRDPALRELPIEFFVGVTPEIIAAARCCLMVSGSVSLEMLARRTPAVVVYRINWWLALLRRIFVACRYLTLTNLMASRELMPEFAFFGSPDEPVQRMAAILSRWVTDPAEHDAIATELDELARLVARPGGTARTADYVLQRLGTAAQQKAA